MENEVVAPSADKMKAVVMKPEVFAMLSKGMAAGQKIEPVPSSFVCPTCKDVPLFYPEPRAMHHLDNENPERQFKKLLCVQCGYEDKQEFVKK